MKSLSGFEPTAVRGKWFEVNDLNHSATDAPSQEKNGLPLVGLQPRYLSLDVFSGLLHLLPLGGAVHFCYV
jgi:hypothetical protein